MSQLHKRECPENSNTGQKRASPCSLSLTRFEHVLVALVECRIWSCAYTGSYGRRSSTMRVALGLTLPRRTCISYRTSRVDRGNLAGVDYCVSRTEINRSVATAFRLRCIEFAWFVLSAGRVRFMRYAITPRSYDKYRRLIFIQPTFHPPLQNAVGNLREIVDSTDSRIYGDYI